jgi:acetyl-CoA synthetase
MANVFDQGTKEIVAFVYLPMIPELVLQLWHVGVELSTRCFWGFQPRPATRINDSDCKMVITSDGGYRGNKTIDLKAC